MRPLRSVCAAASIAACLLMCPRSFAQVGPPPSEAQPPPYPTPPPAAAYPAAPPPPAVLDYDEGQPIPAGYHLVVKPRTEMIWGGIAFFGLTYGIALYVASVGSAIKDSKTGSLFIPVAGPFLAINDLDAKGAGTFWLSVWGIAQGAGVVATIYGLTSPKKALWRNDIGRIDFAPVTATGAPGLTVMGSF